MTKEILEKQTDTVKSTLKMWKERYNDPRFRQDITRAEIRGYVKGLRDAGVISSNLEYRVLFNYTTL